MTRGSRPCWPSTSGYAAIALFAGRGRSRARVASPATAPARRAPAGRRRRAGPRARLGVPDTRRCGRARTHRAPALRWCPCCTCGSSGRHRLLELNLRMRRHVRSWLISTAWGLMSARGARLVHPGVSRARIAASQSPAGNLGGRGPRGTASEGDTDRRRESRPHARGRRPGLCASGSGPARRTLARHALLPGRARLPPRRRRGVAPRDRPSHLEGLSTGLVEAVATLLQVKRAGTIFFHRKRHYAVARPHGFDERAWQQLSPRPRTCVRASRTPPPRWRPSTVGPACGAC